MKNCIIIHGCPSNKEKSLNEESRTYDKHWMPRLQEQLEKQGILTKRPNMPSPWNPDYYNFKKEFEKLDITQDTILIGHSCGSSFLVHWLGETKQTVSMLILVAPRKIPKENAKNDIYRKKFYSFKVDSTIKNRVPKIYLFTSENEEINGQESLRIFSSELGGTVIRLKNHGHYTFHDMQTEAFPELLTLITG